MSGAKKQTDVQVFARALDLINWLQTGQRVTARMIADRYVVTIRTAQRIMTTIELTLPVRCIGQESGMGGRQITWGRKRGPKDNRHGEE